MLYYLHVYVIHSKHLFYREKFITNTLKILEECCKKKGFVFCSETITEDDEVVSEEFSKEHKSNFSKQRTAIRKISAMPEKENEKHYYMCMEDDCVFLNQFICNLELFFDNPEAGKWDIFFMCLSQTDETEFKDTREHFKILPSKECYLITVESAKKLLITLEKMNASYRVQLSQWIQDSPEILSKFLPKRISIEGSKVGIVPSSINDNNALIYNKDFITLYNMMNNEIDITEATRLYKLSEHLKSPEFIHLYAVILFKCGELTKAKELFMEAVTETLYKNGKLDKGTEILNNAINIFGLCQPDRDLYRQEPSKYVLKK
jgi:hypothetical protein